MCAKGENFKFKINHGGGDNITRKEEDDFKPVRHHVEGKQDTAYYTLIFSSLT